MIPAEQRDELRHEHIHWCSICAERECLSGHTLYCVECGLPFPCPLLALLDALEAAERERDLYEVDSTGLASVCRALADVWPTSETMSASEAVYALAERADAAEGRARHLALSRADEHTRAHEAERELARLCDGIAELVEHYSLMESRVHNTPDQYGQGRRDVYDDVEHTLAALLNPTERPECSCFVTPEHMWTRYGSAVEPGSQMEPNPECPVHFPTERTTP